MNNRGANGDRLSRPAFSTVLLKRVAARMAILPGLVVLLVMSAAYAEQDCPDGKPAWIRIESTYIQEFKALTCEDGTTRYEGLGRVKVVGLAVYKLDKSQITNLRSAMRNFIEVRQVVATTQSPFLLQEPPEFKYSIEIRENGDVTTLQPVEDHRVARAYFELIHAQGSYKLRCPILERIRGFERESDICPYEKSEN